MSAASARAPGPGSRTILFGGSGFLGPYILGNYPEMISVGRTRPQTANRHVHIDSLADLRPLADIDFDSVIYIIGNTDHYNLEKDTVSRTELSAFDYHVTPFVQAMEQLKQFPIKKLIHFSTILLYDRERLTLPVDEHAPIDPYRTRYVLSKFMAEEACKFYSAWVPIINVRLSNIYGPTRLDRFDLIHVLVRQLLEHGSGTVWTTKPERDFIYVEDAAHAVVKLLDTDYCGTLNLGTGTMTPISVVVDILREISGCPIEVEGREVNGPMHFRCDMRTLNSLIDWQPRYSTEEGVRRTYELMAEWARN
ncbi:MAG: NAD(P)-dependent oxidoreductase [Gemmatimonadaceae bacterium]|nr:NAD(P)-dependent oxidoreductase [Gemmatimonadaceae bacterium]